MGGIQGRLNKQFAVTIAISVLISAFNALTLSPALSAMLLRPRKEGRGPLARFFAAFNRWFAKATHGYVNVSHRLIRKALVTVAILGAFLLVDAVLGKRLPTSFLPEEDQGYLLFNVQLPDAASLQRTDDVCRKIEKILAETKGVEYATTVVGFSLLSRVSASYNAFFFVSLKPWDERATKAASSKRDRQKLNGRASPRGTRSDRLRILAARDSRPGQRGRLLLLAPGPQWRECRVPRSESPEVPGGLPEAAGADGRQLLVSRGRAAGLRRTSTATRS